MKFTPNTFSNKIGCLLAEFSIELGSPEKTKDKDYAKRYNRIHDKYLDKILNAKDKEALMGKR